MWIHRSTPDTSEHVVVSSGAREMVGPAQESESVGVVLARLVTPNSEPSGTPGILANRTLAGTPGTDADAAAREDVTAVVQTLTRFTRTNPGLPVTQRVQTLRVANSVLQELRQQQQRTQTTALAVPAVATVSQVRAATTHTQLHPTNPTTVVSAPGPLAPDEHTITATRTLIHTKPAHLTTSQAHIIFTAWLTTVSNAHHIPPPQLTWGPADEHGGGRYTPHNETITLDRISIARLVHEYRHHLQHHGHQTTGLNIEQDAQTWTAHILNNALR